MAKLRCRISSNDTAIQGHAQVIVNGYHMGDPQSVRANGEWFELDAGSWYVPYGYTHVFELGLDLPNGGTGDTVRVEVDSIILDSGRVVKIRQTGPYHLIG